MPKHITQEFLDMVKLPEKDGKRLNYLIVMPRMVERDDTSYQFPYGLCIVSSALKATGRNVFTLNLNYKHNHLEYLRNFIIDDSIDVVLSGGLSGQYAILKEIFDTAKSVDTNIITICGGGIITADPLVAMQALETADYGVIGEGEITVNELAHAIETNADSARIRGVVIKSDVLLPSLPLPRGEITNLDCLPFPDYDGFEFEFLMRDGLYDTDGLATLTTNVAISRSCPYNCTFCFHSSGKKYRRRSLDNVFEELDWLIAKYKLTRFTFADELFISNAKLITEFCERIKPYNLTWWAQTRVDTVSFEILSKLKDAGCYTISYGVESADNSILKSMCKNITVEQIDAAFEAAKQAGLEAYGNLIFGDLEETAETIKNSLDWRVSHPEYNIRLGWIITFPGSHLYKTAIERGIISDPVQYLKGGCPQINVSKLSDENYWQTVHQLELFRIMYGERYGGLANKFGEFDTHRFKANLENLLTDCQKIAVWPATKRSLELLNSISEDFIKSEKVYLINIAPNGLPTRGLEQKIQTPDVIAEQNIDTVFCPSLSHVSDIFEQIRDMIDKSYPSVQKIIYIKDLIRATAFTFE
jgi:radical SAM superfamily enzyme YgiQ (UPF0313 family)